MSESFLKSFTHIILVEGGYSDNPFDSGGKTKYGITEQLARRYGYVGLMKDMPLSKAKQIYKTHFWDKLMLDDVSVISYDIAHEMFDTGVNMGRARAGIFLQRSLNVLNYKQVITPDIGVDGLVGGNTLKSLKAVFSKRGDEVLYKMLNSLQGAFYIELAERREKDETFVYGWFKQRVSFYGNF
jgi:lysozyme family protein